MVVRYLEFFGLRSVAEEDSECSSRIQPRDRSLAAAEVNRTNSATFTWRLQSAGRNHEIILLTPLLMLGIIQRGSVELVIIDTRRASASG